MAEANTEEGLSPPARDSLEFAAGVLLGVAAGIGVGLALVESGLWGTQGIRRGKRGRWAGRVLRRLGRG